MQAFLSPAFSWECCECHHKQYVDARKGTLTNEDAASIYEHYETLDSVQIDSEMHESEYLVNRVSVGPAFVQCKKCGKMHATALQE